MIKFLLKLLTLGLIVLLGYYFFLGSPEDKERAKAVFSEIGDVFGELGSFLKAEKDKFDRGEYEAELQKIRELMSDIKSKAVGLTSLQDSADGVKAVLIDQKADALQRLAEKEDLTDEEIRELTQRLNELQMEANELANASGNSELPKLF